MLVYGDTNSTLAGALTAAKLGLPLAHVEAGFRSYDRAMPEEINRVLTDHVARYLFCVTKASVGCLRRGGHRARRVRGRGPDVRLAASGAAAGARRSKPMCWHATASSADGYYLATVHRPANTDDADDPAVDLSRRSGAWTRPWCYRCTRARKRRWQRRPSMSLTTYRPSSPWATSRCWRWSATPRAMLSDSGGVRREAYFLGVPSVTLRDSTEWPETLAAGWDVLAGTDPDRIVEGGATVHDPRHSHRRSSATGNAAQKIVEVLERDPPNS